MRRVRVDQKSATLRRNNEKGFIAYLSAGDPFLKESIVLRLEGADVDVNKFHTCPYIAEGRAKTTTFVKQIVDAVKKV